MNFIEVVKAIMDVLIAVSPFAISFQDRSFIFDKAVARMFIAVDIAIIAIPAVIVPLDSKELRDLHKLLNPPFKAAIIIPIAVRE